MAIIHRATLHPTKFELISPWLAEQEWFTGTSVADTDRIGAFRFDDPAGEVGVETMLLADRGSDGASGAVVQVPLTYRAAPLPGAESSLIGTLEHSVLGTRWVYDGVGDPVYAGVLAAAIFAGQPQADLMIHADGKVERGQWTVELRSSGQLTGGPVETLSPAEQHPHAVTADGVTTIRTGGLDLKVVRTLDPAAPIPAENALSATWEGQPTPVLLAFSPATS